MDVDADKLKGMTVLTIIDCNKDDNGYWKVTQRVKHRRLLEESDDWEEKEVIMSAIDKDLERASGMAMTSVIIFLESVNGNLFNDPEEVYTPVESKTDLIQ
jgi:hypothetical protein